ncbi:MAG: ribonuclease J [Rhodospirillaceae bacterium]|nr:ribonuclease J [Rhodospirillaceae bacterium]
MSADTDQLLFLPLGGAGEIGMNLNLYGYGPPDKERWMMVDLGITFGDGAVPGVDVVMADPAFIEERIDQLDGLVLTHAHEDHLGAVAHLWERLRCPVYATPFTAEILGHKLAEAGLDDRVPVTIVPLKGKFSVGPFDLELITLTHSIPEPNAIVIRTPAGMVLHTGDWKFDPDPVVGEVSDEAALKALGAEGTLAIVCDSTNVFSEGTSGSEGDLLESLTQLIGTLQKRVVVACFASNVARMETIAAAAAANDRDVVLAGRALWRFNEVGRNHGCLTNTPTFLEAENAGFLPRDKTLIICTGSQGEPRAALARIASGNHPHITLEPDDTVIFSARAIPGNEKSIGHMQNKLIRAGIQVMTEKDHFVHVSGHPARDELIRMYQHVQPKIAIPVHGELRHMAEHARLAHDCQVTSTLVGENGTMMRIAPGEPAIVDLVPYGRLALEGNRVVPLDGELIRGRKRALWNGTVIVTVILDKGGKLAAEPMLTSTGVLDDGDAELEEAALNAARQAVLELDAKERADDAAANEAVRRAVRRFFRDQLDKSPITGVHLIRLE